HKYNNSQTKNYSTLFSTVSKTWLSGPECWPRKYGWFSSGRKKQGFTIIEVVLVLAIAGLIFLMVFIALPALQRSQRDAQRKNDMTRVVAATAQMRANNRGRIPDSTEGSRTFNDVLKGNYLTAGGDQFKDPDGSEYFFVDGTWPPRYDSSESFVRKDPTGLSIIYVFLEEVNVRATTW
ncbi:MAG: type II secretion system protein, partial [Candidatus Sacchiramonaceae bacterium]|nr:type II secretion system protein [Candidatus Saccharimonadaceae bacterium]